MFVSPKEDVPTFIMGIDRKGLFLTEIHFMADADESNLLALVRFLVLNGRPIDVKECDVFGLAVFHFH